MGQESADTAHTHLSGAGEELKAAAKDSAAAFSSAGQEAKTDAHANKDVAKGEVGLSFHCCAPAVSCLLACSLARRLQWSLCCTDRELVTQPCTQYELAIFVQTRQC